MLKKIVLLLILILSLIPYIALGQLKRQDSPAQIKEEITRPYGDQFIGFSIFDPARFNMSHSFSMSYFSVGGKGLSQSLYLNTMSYQLASPLLLKVQWGIQGFPYNSLAKNNPVFQSGLFLSGAELQYKPNDKFEVRLQFNSMPGYMYNRNRYENPFQQYQNSLWEDEK